MSFHRPYHRWLCAWDRRERAPPPSVIALCCRRGDFNANRSSASACLLTAELERNFSGGWGGVKEVVAVGGDE